MALIASDPGQTSRGDDLADDGFISTFKVVRQVAKTHAIAATEKTKGRDEHAAHTLVNIGNCEEMVIDAETGFVGVTDVLHYTCLLCTTDHASLKKAVTAWFKKGTATTIASMLIQRDRGTSSFSRKEDDVGEFFLHPMQLLSNIEVGINTRPWLVSVAAFGLSYHQLLKAFQQNPKDFARVEDHIELLQTRIAILNDETCMGRLVESALMTKPPYADFNYTSMAKDAISRLSLLARVDLEVLRYIKKQGDANAVPKKTKKGSTTSSDTQDSLAEVNVEKLRFLQAIAETNGDLWAIRSAHTYNIDEQVGAVVVFPSGYLYSIVGAPGVTAQQLMRDRTCLSRMESIIPYLPYELSGYSGSISSLAKLEADQRGKKSAAKIDTDAARVQIAEYAKRLTLHIITDPLLLSLMSKRAEPTPAPRKSKQAPPPPEPESEHDEEDEVVDE